MELSSAQNIDRRAWIETGCPCHVFAAEDRAERLAASTRPDPRTLRGRVPLGLCLAWCFSFVAVPAAHAHKVNVFAYVEGTRVCVEGYFGGNSKAKHCAVEVLNSAGTVLARGETDDKGLFSFALSDIPKGSGDLTVVLQAGSGHRTTYTLRAKELPISLAGSESVGFSGSWEWMHTL